jgi:hypothetical protein
VGRHCVYTQAALNGYHAMTYDAAVMALISCAFGLTYLALRRYTDWTQYNYGILEIHKLLTATRAVWLKWTVVWTVESGCAVSVAYVFMRLVDPR